MTGKVYAVTNKKGGVGKTTTCEQLADIASNRVYGYGKKVLGISFDPQGNWDNSLGIKKGTPGIYEFVVNEFDTRVKISSTFDFIPSYQAGAIRTGLERSQEPFSELRFSNELSMILHEYDFVVIDCPPDEEFLNNCIYAASNSLIVPITTDRYSIEGIVELSKKVNKIRILNPNLAFEGILITKVKRNTMVSKEIYTDAQECASVLNTRVFNSQISLSTVVEQAQRSYQTLMQYDKNAKVTLEYGAFVKEILENEDRQGGAI